MPRQLTTRPINLASSRSIGSTAGLYYSLSGNLARLLKHKLGLERCAYLGLSLALGLFLSLALSQPAQAQHRGFDRETDYHYLEFRQIDWNFVEQSLATINAISRENYGTALRQSAAHDLPLLQRLLEDELIDRDDLHSAQAAGVALGATLATELDLDWIRYADRAGISRALRVRHTEQVLFPISMISRRYRVGITPDVRALYSAMSGKVQAARSLDGDY